MTSTPQVKRTENLKFQKRNAQTKKNQKQKKKKKKKKKKKQLGGGGGET